MSLDVVMRGDTELVARLERLPADVKGRLRQKVYFLAEKLRTKVITEKLSGQVLKVVTGALRRSIQTEVEETESGVRGVVYSASDVKYAAIHEFGGRTSPHIILPVKAQALAFVVGGKQVFAKMVNHPGSVMPERSFLRSSLREMEEEIKAGLKEAVLGAAKEV